MTSYSLVLLEDGNKLKICLDAGKGGTEIAFYKQSIKSLVCLSAAWLTED